MITNFQEFVNNSQPILDALRDLNIFDKNNEFQSQQSISIRLKSFFENAQTKKQFLKSLFKIFERESQKEGNFQIKLKLLLLLHLILSSQVARAELSKILISKQINIQINNTTLGKVCQQYYFYLYKLASQTTFINEDVINGELLIYFTLSNQCILGIGIQSQIEDVDSFQTNHLLANTVKFIYYDLQDIAIFIMKDVKSLIENQYDSKQKNCRSLSYIKKQILYLILIVLSTLIKDAQFLSIQSQLFAFSQIMPPFSLVVEQRYLKDLQNNTTKMHSQTNMNKLNQERVKYKPQTTKQRQMIKFEFAEQKQQPESPHFSFSN